MIDRPTSVLEQSNCSAANLRRAAAPRQLELQCNVATPPTPLQPIWLNCPGSRSTCFLEISMAHSTRSPLATNFLTKLRFQNHMRARPVFADTNKIVDNILVSYPTRRSQCTNNIQNIWAKKYYFATLNEIQTVASLLRELCGIWKLSWVELLKLYSTDGKTKTIFWKIVFLIISWFCQRCTWSRWDGDRRLVKRSKYLDLWLQSPRPPLSDFALFKEYIADAFFKLSLFTSAHCSLRLELFTFWDMQHTLLEVFILFY